MQKGIKFRAYPRVSKFRITYTKTCKYVIMK